MIGWMKKVPVMRFSGRPPAAADTLLRTTEIDHGAQKETTGGHGPYALYARMTKSVEKLKP